jgi:predicted nucleic acid-binding protein
MIVETPTPPKELVVWDLGEGETAVLSLAMADQKWTAILDDAAARRCARSFNVPIKGTLAVVIQAKQRGLIPSAVDVLRTLRLTGFRLDDQVLREALADTIGEVWEG